MACPVTALSTETSSITSSRRQGLSRIFCRVPSDHADALRRKRTTEPEPIRKTVDSRTPSFRASKQALSRLSCGAFCGATDRAAADSAYVTAGYRADQADAPSAMLSDSSLINDLEVAPARSTLPSVAVRCSES